MKKFLLILLALFLSFSLVACNNKSKSEKKESNKNNQEQVVSPKDVSVDIADNTFPEKTVVNVSSVKKGSSFNTVSAALNSTAEKFTVYDIEATLDNKKIQPNGTVKVTFPISKDYDLERVAVVYISDDGKTEQIPSQVNKEKRTVVATLSHFSLYAVIEAIATDTLSETINNTTTGATTDIVPDDATATTPDNATNSTTNKPANVTPSTPPNTNKGCAHTYTQATCTTPKTCSKCKATAGSALGHNYSNGSCSRCQTPDPNFKQLVYVNGVGYNLGTVITMDIILKTHDTDISVFPAYFTYKEEGNSLVPSQSLYFSFMDETEEVFELTDSHGGPIELGELSYGYWVNMFCNPEDSVDLSSGKTIYRIKCKLSEPGSYKIEVRDGYTATQNGNKYTSSLSLKIY